MSQGASLTKTGMRFVSKKWWKAAGIRAIKTFAQAAVAMIGTSVVISDVNWQVAIGAAALAAVLSLLTSLAGLPEVDDDV